MKREALQNAENWPEERPGLLVAIVVGWIGRGIATARQLALSERCATGRDAKGEAARDAAGPEARYILYLNITANSRGGAMKRL